MSESGPDFDVGQTIVNEKEKNVGQVSTLTIYIFGRKSLRGNNYPIPICKQNFNQKLSNMEKHAKQKYRIVRYDHKSI
jgi:hypothetical protein